MSKFSIVCVSEQFLAAETKEVLLKLPPQSALVSVDWPHSQAGYFGVCRVAWRLSDAMKVIVESSSPYGVAPEVLFPVLATAGLIVTEHTMFELELRVSNRIGCLTHLEGAFLFKEHDPKQVWWGQPQNPLAPNPLSPFMPTNPLGPIAPNPPALNPLKKK